MEQETEEINYNTGEWIIKMCVEHDIISNTKLHIDIHKFTHVMNSILLTIS